MPNAGRRCGPIPAKVLTDTGIAPGMSVAEVWMPPNRGS
jgi:hypothetical protein